MSYRTAIFDLDGTITDSAPGIIASVKYALQKKNFSVPSDEKLRSFVGPPLHKQFQKFCGLSDEESKKMVSFYREYYSKKGIFENSVYPDIPKILEKLVSEKIRLLIATSKPETYARIIAEHFGFSKYFDFIGGACMDGKRTDKHEVIEYVLETCRIHDRKTTVMIGDRRHDILGASRSGIQSIGVLYGYGSKEELQEAGATYIAEMPEDLLDIIL